MVRNTACLFGTRDDEIIRAFIEITDLCNMKCLHCMNNSGDLMWKGMKKELLITLLDELKIKNVKELYISGGEPLLYYAIDEILEYAHSLGMKIVLATNGLEIETHIESIKNHVHTVSISLDGIGDTHDFFRGVKGAFLRTKLMIQLLSKLGVNMKISTIIWKNNIDELEEIVKLAKSNGVSKVNFNILVPLGRAKNNQNIHIENNQYYYIYEKINDLSQKYKNNKFDIEIKRSHRLNKNSISCPGGKNLFHINSKGKISPCSWMAKIDEKGEYSMVWTPGKINQCIKQCEKIDIILEKRKNSYLHSGCPALANIHNGTYMAEDPIESRLIEPII